MLEGMKTHLAAAIQVVIIGVAAYACFVAKTLTLDDFKTTVLVVIGLGLPTQVSALRRGVSSEPRKALDEVRR